MGNRGKDRSHDRYTEKWMNYMEASGWGQEGNHKTQLAYLCTVVSDEIRTAINFDSMTTVARAIHEI